MVNTQRVGRSDAIVVGSPFIGDRFSKEGRNLLVFAHLKGKKQPVTLGAAVQAYVQWLEAKGYAKATVICVRNVFSAFYRESSLNENSPLAGVTERVAERADKRFATRYNPSTSWRYRTMLMQVFRYFASGGLLLSNPFAKLQRPDKPDILPKPALNAEEISKLLQGPNTRFPWGIRTRAFLEVLYSTGVRLSECSSLKLADVDMQQGTLRIMGKGSRERLVPIGQEALKWIQRYIKEVRPRYAGPLKELWVGQTGKPLNRLCIQRAIKEIAQKVGIEKPVTAHTLRRTFATHLLSRGASARVVMEILGHRDGSVIERYVRVHPKELQNAHEKTHPRR